ncbi:hypothetical protein BH11MYX2_BH11MYX2_16750 [soil metagenome]
MKTLFVAVVLVLAPEGCGVAPLPAETPRATVAETDVLPAPLVITGELIAWDVWWQGVQVGSAVVETSTTGSRAQFATGGLASIVGTLRFEQATIARSTTEDLVAGSAREHRVIALDTVTVPGGSRLHTLASTLGSVRSWAKVGAPHAYAWVLVDGALYRVDVATPHPDAQTLRVDGSVRPLDPDGDSVDFSVWLADDATRTPVRFAALARGERVTAQIRDSSAITRR